MVIITRHSFVYAKDVFYLKSYDISNIENFSKNPSKMTFYYSVLIIYIISSLSKVMMVLEWVTYHIKKYRKKFDKTKKIKKLYL